MSEGEPEPDPRASILALAITVEGGLIGLAWALGWLFGTLPLDRFAWDVTALGWGVLAAVPMVLAFLLLFRLPWRPMREIRRFSEETIYPLMRPCTVIDLLGISLLAGLGEEMLFRGVLQGTFARYLPSLMALALASVLFGVLHAVTFTYAVLATLMGAYLGWLWAWTDNLLAPVVTHAAYDFFVLLWFLRGPGQPAAPPAEDEAAGPE